MCYATGASYEHEPCLYYVCYVTGASYGHVQALQAPGRFEDTPGDSEGGQ